MADVLDFIPLFPDDDEETILARMRDWANEGLDPDVDVDQWVDTREGSHWHAAVMPGVKEKARLYDLAGTEVPASGFPLFAWGDYLDDHAAVQNIVRLAATYAAGEVTFSGPAGTVIAAGTTVGVEPVNPDDPVPTFEVTVGGVIPGVAGVDPDGEVTLTIRATETGVAGNVSAGAITVAETPLPGIDVTNAAETVGGSEVESDEALRERVLAAYKGQGAGNRRDYERWARAWAGVGRATVIPLWNGPGTVKVIVTDANGGPVSPETVAGLQNDLDPNPGLADGQAPVSAIVTVTTAVELAIDIDATIEFETGFDLDGFGGQIGLRQAITDSLRAYVERVEPGGEVVYEQVKGRIVTVEGVHDVSAVTLNGAAVNVPVSADPAEVPAMNDPTLAEA